MLATTVLGLLTTVGAIAIYVRLPTEWSSMLACIAPILQAFVLVQLLFETKEERD